MIQLGAKLLIDGFSLNLQFTVGAEDFVQSHAKPLVVKKDRIVNVT